MELPNSNKEIACFSLALMYQFVKDRGIPDDQIFKNIQQYKQHCINPYEWIQADIWIRMAKNIEEALSGEPEPLFALGENVVKNQISNFQLFFLKIAPLAMIVQRIKNHIIKNMHKSVFAEASLSAGRGRVKFYPQNLESYSSQICDFNRGCTHGVLQLKGCRNIRLIETQCAARSDAPSCIYEFTWDPAPSILEHIKNFFLFRVRDQRSIIRHMEQSHNKLQVQYREIMAMRDFYSHIMQNMHESVVWLTEEGHIDFANEAFAELVGRDRATLQANRLNDLIDASSSRGRLTEALAACTVKPGRPEVIELGIARPDNSRRIGQATIVWVASQHRAPGFNITIRDITESKKMERELMLAQDRYRALYENSPALIVGIDRGGRIIYANPAAVEQTGYSENELTSMHFGKLVAPDASFDTNRLLERLISEPSRLQEVHYRTKDGEWKTIAFNSYQIYDDIDVGGIAGIGIDITETKRLNEQLIKTQRMELLGQMAGGLAHDFNNIMTAIYGYAHIISQRSGEEKSRNQASVILSAADRASELVRKLLSFSRGDKVEIKNFDLRELVQEAGALIRGSTSSSIAVNMIVPEEPLIIYGDATKIHQCILNLGVNARDAIGRKSDGAITVRLRESPEDAARVWIQVEDNGGGIPPDVIERIFDPFFSTKEKKEGAGLGLSVVYGIIKAHQGDIAIDSRPGEGTIFTIDLPVFQSQADEAEAPRTVAVVDGDRVLRGFCLEVLHSAGYHVKEFAAAKEALEWISANRRHLVCTVIDVNLSGLNVSEFISSCRAQKPELPLIWLSSQVTGKTKTLVTSGLFIQKPFAPAELLDAVKSIPAPENSRALSANCA